MLLNADRKVRHTGWISSGPPDSAALIAGVIAAHTRDLSALALGSSPVGVFLTYSFFDLLWVFFFFFLDLVSREVSSQRRVIRHLISITSTEEHVPVKIAAIAQLGNKQRY